MILKLKNTPGIYLVGFMGSGKTTIGRLLAERLGWHFADLDDEIEAQQGSSIAEIFDLRGEEEFRRIETGVVRAQVRTIERGRPTVVALGGGTFAQQANFDLLENNGVSIWLDCPLETVSAAWVRFPTARWPAICSILKNCTEPARRRTRARITAFQLRATNRQRRSKPS